MSYPDLRPSKLGHWPPRLTSIPVGQPILAEHLYGSRYKGVVVGWVEPPASWRPHDLLWKPDGTKALDLAGEIVNAEKIATVDDRLWITSQLKLRDRWLEAIRQKILSGAAKLTPALAKALGIPFDDGALLEDPREQVWRELQAQLGRVAS